MAARFWKGKQVSRLLICTGSVTGCKVRAVRTTSVSHSKLNVRLFYFSHCLVDSGSHRTFFFPALLRWRADAHILFNQVLVLRISLRTERYWCASSFFYLALQVSLSEHFVFVNFPGVRDCLLCAVNTGCCIVSGAHMSLDQCNILSVPTLYEF